MRNRRLAGENYSLSCMEFHACSRGITLSILDGKRILLGISGSIAAYKTAELARLLIGQGAEVQAVMTDAARRFITPMTLQALTGRTVRAELFDAAHEAAMGHIELARWAQRILIAPASAGFMARLAGGYANDLLTTLCLASPAPRLLAPAMNQGMWADASVRDNVTLLRQRGATFLGPDEGGQACGDNGLGRMLAPERIVDLLAVSFQPESWRGRRVMLTAGPTREAIDPVRYLSNHSSGKMGYAIASALRERGAEVVMVSGPVALSPPEGVRLIRVESAEQMYNAVIQGIHDCDVFIATAAVADYRPVKIHKKKTKKQGGEFTLRLTPNPDILRSVATLKNGPFTLGFAAETHDVTEYARAKLKDKQLDAIAANLVGGDQGGFARDENALTVIWPTGEQHLGMRDKRELAYRLLDVIEPLILESGKFMECRVKT